MKNMLVTGGCGFIGVNFIRHLLNETDFEGRVINVDKLTYAGNPESLTEIQIKFPNRYVFVKSDICDINRLAKIFDDYQIDIVCHFAAESHVDRSIVNPIGFIQTNIIGTYNLLEVCRERLDKITLFHHISTDEVYGSLGDAGYFNEETPYKPNSPYSASKAASDHLVKAYFKTYKLPVTISNCSNNYGPYQYPEKLIPLIILNVIEWKPLPVYGNGKNVRDWLYVKDHCVAIWTIMKKGKHGETYNVGGNSELKNINLVEMICDILYEEYEDLTNYKSPRELITFVTDRPGHDRRYAVDSTKLNVELGWRPNESFDSGIHKTIKWYVDNTEWINSVRTGEYQSWILKHYGH